MRPEVGPGNPSVLQLAFNPLASAARRDVEQVMVTRINASLIVVFLSARVFHLTQAAIAISVARSSFTRPSVAELLAAACLVESLALTAVIARDRELFLGALLGEAVFGAAGLLAMSYATSADIGAMTGSLDWMLPYTIATVAGLGLVVWGRFQTGPVVIGSAGEQRSWSVLRCAGVAGVAVALAATFVLSVVVPDGAHGAGKVAPETVFYLVFFAGASCVSWLLRARVAVVAESNAQAQLDAAAVAREAQWRVVLIDVFGPSLDLFERAARITDGVPESMQREAGRLMDVIESLRGTDAIC